MLPKLRSIRFREAWDLDRVGFACDITSLLPLLPGIDTFELCCEHPDLWNNAILPPSPPFGIDLHSTANIDPRILSPQPPDGTIDSEDLSLHLHHQAPSITWPVISSDYPKLPNLRCVRLHATPISESKLAAFLFACPSLEYLKINFGGHNHTISVSTRDELSINQALIALINKLRTLEILGCSCSTYLGHQPPSGDKPAEYRLWCLPFFHRLEHLEIDFYGLFGFVPYLTSHLASKLSARIPRSLRSLELAMRWDDDAYIPDEAARALVCSEAQLIVRALIALMADRRRQLARLVLVVRNTRSSPASFATLTTTIRQLLTAARHYGVRKCRIRWWNESYGICRTPSLWPGPHGGTDDVEPHPAVVIRRIERVRHGNFLAERLHD